MADKSESPYQRFKSIDVKNELEKKGSFNYLSWSFAIDKLLTVDPNANWEFQEPTKYGETMMIHCTVTACGITRSAFLPVMDMKNQSVKNPDANAVNKAMQRCLVKAIAMHGLGLSVYAGEDLPDDVAVKPKKVIPTDWKKEGAAIAARIKGATSADNLADILDESANSLEACQDEDAAVYKRLKQVIDEKQAELAA